MSARVGSTPAPCGQTSSEGIFALRSCNARQRAPWDVICALVPGMLDYSVYFTTSHPSSRDGFIGDGPMPARAVVLRMGLSAPFGGSTCDIGWLSDEIGLRSEGRRCAFGFHHSAFPTLTLWKACDGGHIGSLTRCSSAWVSLLVIAAKTSKPFRNTRLPTCGETRCGAESNRCAGRPRRWTDRIGGSCLRRARVERS